MKRSIKIIAIFFTMAAFAFIPPKHNLRGKWTVFNADRTPTGEYVELKNDGTYNVYLPGGKIGEKGYYKLKHDVFSIRNAKDDVCGKGYWGKYKLEFHGDDSIRFSLIKDTCSNRRMDIVGVNPGMRRMKTE